MARILAQPGNPVALGQPVRSQHGNNSARALLELRKGQRIAILFERNLIRFFKRPVADELIECELLRFSHEASPLFTAFAASCHLGCYVQPVSRHFQRPADRARFSRITSHRNSPTGPAMKVATRIGAWTSREKFFASASRAIHKPAKRSKAR